MNGRTPVPWLPGYTMSRLYAVCHYLLREDLGQSVDLGRWTTALPLLD